MSFDVEDVSSHHEDEEELKETPTARSKGTTGSSDGNKKQGEVNEEEDFLAAFTEMTGIKRFDDSEDDSDEGILKHFFESDASV